MAKRFLKYISCLAIVCVLLTTIAVPAYAYVKCGYKLKGSWYDDHYYISDTSVTYNTIMHEMGHIFGLKHSTTTGALMVSNSASYTELTLPQSDDISGVRAIYE